jgi:uncharacterized protein (TIGR03118 family)
MLRRAISLLSILSILFLAALGAAADASPRRPGASAAGQPHKHGYRVVKLVSDVQGGARAVDPNLVNAWGLAAGPTTPWWVADNHADASTLYDGRGSVLELVVQVEGGVTGTVFNGGSDFVVDDGTYSGPSLFLFDTEAGTIVGWNAAVPPPAPSTDSFVVADRSAQGAIYKGLAIASTPDGDFLYAADFHNARVDVFDGDFNLVSDATTFVDPDIPSGFAPFGIQNIDGTIFVAYAKQDAAAEDEEAGAGLGYVDAFDTSGALIGRVASQGALNAPWGLAMAPSSGFGKLGGDLLVGNFGDGRIHAFERSSSGDWEPAGTMRTRSRRPVTIDGLWALEFGTGDVAGPANALYFTAGPDDETHGLFGKIVAVPRS